MLGLVGGYASDSDDASVTQGGGSTTSTNINGGGGDETTHYSNLQTDVDVAPSLDGGSMFAALSTPKTEVDKAARRRAKQAKKDAKAAKKLVDENNASTQLLKRKTFTLNAAPDADAQPPASSSSSSSPMASRTPLAGDTSLPSFVVDDIAVAAAASASSASSSPSVAPPPGMARKRQKTSAAGNNGSSGSAGVGVVGVAAPPSMGPSRGGSGAAMAAFNQRAYTTAPHPSAAYRPQATTTTTTTTTAAAAVAAVAAPAMPATSAPSMALVDFDSDLQREMRRGGGGGGGGGMSFVDISQDDVTRLNRAEIIDQQLQNEEAPAAAAAAAAARDTNSAPEARMWSVADGDFKKTSQLTAKHKQKNQITRLAATAAAAALAVSRKKGASAVARRETQAKYGW
jgi:hypothetical protein